ncbi:MAG: thiamine pyrophosphate-binding protein [Elusimicrobia bacterium]|nr:thiamine pyrophosphate-binding protein [Elusimicrobiota bacterium]
MPASHLILEHLEAEGVRHIFGIPGGPLMPLYEALHDRGAIKPVLAKHEEGAAFMADAYARVSGRFGVCCATTGPGATNALTGIAAAWADHIPVLLLTAQVPTRHFGRGAFQESGPQSVDVVSLYRPVTKWSAMIPHPERTGTFVRTALRMLQTGRPGPVHLNLPYDFLTQRVEAESAEEPGCRRREETFDRSAVKAAAAALIQARRPVILAGNGVNLGRAWKPLAELAKRFNIPVATTFKAKGAFPEGHPLSLGVFSQSGDPAVREFVAGYGTDVLLVVGTGLGEASSCGWDCRFLDKRLLQVDIDSEVIGRNFPVHVALTGDAGTVLRELCFQLERELGPGQRRPVPLDLPSARVSLAGAAEPAASGPVCLSPRTVMRELRSALPEDAVVFVDNGSIRTWAGRYFPVPREGCFFVNMGLASMGYAVAGCIGGKLAEPKRVVVALVGDAAFAMNGMEVHTAVEYGIPVIWVVANNGGHGMIYHGERLQFHGKFCSSIFKERLRISSIAAALGAASILVERPGELAKAVRRALEARKPCVIEVAMDLAEVPPMGARVEALQREAAMAGRTS